MYRPIANLNKQSEVLLKTVNAVEIPPKSESIIPVSVPPFYKSQLSVVEPATSLNLRRLALAKAIVYPSKNRTVCKVLNPTDKTVYLGRRAVIGTIQGIAAEDICSDVDVDTEVNPVPRNEVPTTLAERLEAIASKEIKLERHEMTEEQYEQLFKCFGICLVMVFTTGHSCQ